MNLIDVAAAILADAGFVAGAAASTEVAPALYWGRIPDTPDLVLCVFENPGVGPHLVMGAPVAVERPRIQLLARGGLDEYPAARRVLLAARAALTSAGRSTDGANPFAALAFIPDDAVHSIGVDDRERPMLSANLTGYTDPE